MLTGKQRHYLRGLGHGLKPVVLIGKGGIDDGLIAAVDRALLDHELIKLKLGEHAELDRHEAATEIADKTKSEVAQVLGHVVLLYRPHPKDPKIELPRPGKPTVKPAPKLAPKSSAKRDRAAD
jgi:RNA-binding protein